MTTNSILRYSIITGLFAVLFIPFIVASSQFFPFITGKGFVFRILVEVLLVLWVALAFRDKTYAPKASYILWAIALFLGAIGVADLFGAMPYKSFWSNFERMEGYITMLHLATYFIITASVLQAQKVWDYFFNTSIAASILMTLYGFMQLSGKLTINQGGVRVDGTFGNATYLAVYMLFHIFFCLWYFIKSRNVGARIYYVVAMLLQFIILYKTATRGAMLGLVGGLILTSLIIAIFGKQNPRLRKVAIGGLAALIILIGGFISIRNTNFVQSSPELSRFAAISVSKISSQGRYYVWPMAVQGFKERPVLGWGQENFNYVFNKYYNPLMYAHEQWFDRTHNTFLDWLIVGGIIGLLSYLSLFAALLYYIYKSSLPLSEKAVIIGLIAAYTFNNIFVFDNLISYIMIFALLAYFHGVHATQGKSTFKVFESSESKPHISQVAIAVAGVLMIFVLYTANIKPILANRALIGGIATLPGGLKENMDNFEKIFTYHTFADAETSEQLLSNIGRFGNEQVPQDVRLRYAELARKSLQDQVDRAPNDARYALFLGSLQSRLGDLDGAITNLEKALTLSPKKQAIFFELGAAYTAKGDTKKGLEIFKQAFDLAPDYQEARLAYAAAAIMANDQKLASEILMPLKKEVVAFDPRILNALIASKRLADAVVILETRVSLEPNNAQHYLLLAAAYLDAGQRTKSVQTLRKLIEINPDFKAQGEYYIKEIEAGRNP